MSNTKTKCELCKQRLDERPHNINDCVKHLAQRLKDLEQEIFDLNHPNYHE